MVKSIYDQRPDPVPELYLTGTGISPRIPISNEEQRYSELREMFIEHMHTSDGPYRITMALLYRFNCQCFTASSDDTLKIEPIFQRLITEFCPIQLQIPISLMVVKEIMEVDDNTDYIYAIGHQARTQDRFLCISDEAVAVILRLAL